MCPYFAQLARDWWAQYEPRRVEAVIEKSLGADSQDRCPTHARGFAGYGPSCRTLADALRVLLTDLFYYVSDASDA